MLYSLPALTSRGESQSYATNSNYQLVDSRIPAHRIILMAASKYSEARLGPNFIEETKKEIPLDEIDESTLSNVLDFIYSGQIEITVDNVEC